MRLFLSSYRAGAYEQKLRNFASSSRKVLVITNAKDDKDARERDESVKEVFDFFKKLDLMPQELDLRLFFGRTKISKTDLEKNSFIWVAGGNTFVLRRAMKMSGCDKLMSSMVKNSEIVYGGESAGAILVCPTLTGVEYGDDPYVVPKGYEREIIWAGLNLIPYHLVPHYKSEWPGADDMIGALKDKHYDFKTLTDSQAVIIDGEKQELLK